jgi:hypothetical protein
MYSKAYMVPNPLTPNQAIFINADLCTCFYYRKEVEYGVEKIKDNWYL